MTPERMDCLERLAGLILAIDRPHPVRVAIDGPDAAGKTVLADELAPIIEGAGRPVIRASIDGFHRPRAQRLARGPDSPKGYFRDSFDYVGLRAALLQPLGPDGDRRFRRRVFDYLADEPVISQIEAAPPDSVLLFDGVFLLRRELGDVWDFSVFVAAPFTETVRRAKTRDRTIFGSEDEVIRRYAARYVPGQMLYYASEQPQSRADAIVENGDIDKPRLRIRREDGPA
ncbi:MAG: uridine kinase [Candidatus Limnocylindrales bacterium]